ncbi:MAG: flippase [Treponema sp.]|nr:flippase [Treponema sp.]MBQ6056179.1 flippase [Treponema sp.]
MSQKSIKKNAFYSVIRSFASICFPIISFPYISRILNPDGIGKINFSNSFVDYFIMFAGLGITSYAGREAAKIRENATELNKLSRELIIINTLSTIISYILLFIITFSVSKLTQYYLLITICSSKILFETLGLNWLFIAEEDYGYITIRSIFFQFLSLICMFLFVHTEQDLFIYAIITVLSSVGSNIFNLFYARKYINVFERTKIELKKHLAPIFIFFGVSIAGRIYASIDTLMLGFMLDDTATGIYTAANKITFMIHKVISAAIIVMMPKCSNLFAKGKIDEYKSLIKKGLEFSILLATPASVGLMILTKPLILIFCGSQYTAAFFPMKILSFFILISTIENILYSNILIPIKKEKAIFLAQIIGLLTNIIINCLLIPILNVTGAVIGTIISEIITLLIMIYFSNNYFPVKKFCLLICKYSLFTFIMAIPTYLLSIYLKGNISQLFVCTITGCFVYLLCLIVTKNELLIQTKEFLVKKIKKEN